MIAHFSNRAVTTSGDCVRKCAYDYCHGTMLRNFDAKAESFLRARPFLTETDPDSFVLPANRKSARGTTIIPPGGRRGA
jgi:hypothetical protein